MALNTINQPTIGVKWGKASFWSKWKKPRHLVFFLNTVKQYKWNGVYCVYKVYLYLLNICLRGRGSNTNYITCDRRHIMSNPRLIALQFSLLIVNGTLERKFCVLMNNSSLIWLAPIHFHHGNYLR